MGTYMSHGTHVNETWHTHTHTHSLTHTFSLSLSHTHTHTQVDLAKAFPDGHLHDPAVETSHGTLTCE